MGGGSSKPKGNAYKAPDKANHSTAAGVTDHRVIGIERRHSLNSIGTLASQKRKRMHEHNEALDHDHVFAPTINDEIDPASKHLLSSVLTKALYLDHALPTYEALLTKLIQSLEHNMLPKNSLFITQGEVPEGKMYIVDHGQIEIQVDGETTCVAERGSCFGELSMLFDAPSKCTVFSLTGLACWILKRENFRKLQRSAAVDTHMHRLLRLKNVKEFRRALTSQNLSSLTNMLLKKTYAADSCIFESGKTYTNIYLIESGSATIEIPEALKSLEECELLAQLGITLPTEEAGEEANALRPEQIAQCGKVGDNLIRVGEGCILGTGILRGRGGLDHGWEWDAAKNGAISPITVACQSPLSCSFFSVMQFEQLLGPASEVLARMRVEEDEKEFGRETDDAELDEQSGALKFSVDSFIKIQVFNSIHMGFGAFAIGRSSTRGSNKSTHDEGYNLKILSKSSVVAERQKKHVLREAEVLATLNHAFVAKMFGRFQTPNELLFVFEWIPGGDLYHLLHEHSSFSSKPGLDAELVRFYSANIVIALGYLRGAGVAYRNLRPENVMFTRNGYIKLIGFGIAKRIPFRGPNNHYLYKTHTLCGFTDYMAPEMVLHQGHDHGVDLWALGVLVFELITGKTPFSGSSGVVDNAGVLKRIASMISSTDALDFSAYPEFTDPAFAPAEALIRGLLAPKPAERLGVHWQDQRGAFGSEFFTSVKFDWDAVNNQEMTAPYVPTNLSGLDPTAPPRLAPEDIMFWGMPESTPYTGDQAAFESF